MRAAIFSAKSYERKLLDELNGDHHELVYFDALLGPDTASLAEGFPVVSVFVNDLVDGVVLKQLGDLADDVHRDFPLTSVPAHRFTSATDRT